MPSGLICLLWHFLVALICLWRYSAATWQYILSKIASSPVFDLLFIKRFQQWTAWSVFGSLDPLSMTEFFINRLKRTEIWGWMWMASRAALKRDIFTNYLTQTHPVDIPVDSKIGVGSIINL